MIKVSTSDKMKAIAILMVIAGHILGNYFPANPYLCMILGTGGVTVFFMLSGYGLAASYKSKGITGSYWDRKIQKVMIPYWIVTLIFIFVKGYYTLDSTILLKNMFFVDFERNLDGTMWYLSFLMIWYLLFWLIFRFEYSLVIKILLLFVLGVWFFLNEQSPLFLDCAWQFSRNALSFPIGVVLGLFTAQKYPKVLDKNWLRAILFAAAAGGIVCYYCLQTDRRIPTQANGICVFVSLLVLCTWISKSRRLAALLDRIGDMSYLMYLIEAKWFAVIALLGIQNGWTLAALYVVSFIVLMIVIYLIRKAIRKKKNNS